MAKSSSSRPPAKRAKSSATVKGTKNAFDIMAASARLCWPSSRQSAVSVLEIVAKNGWLSWQDDEEPRQSPTFSNLRLTSRGVKMFMDEPAHGGPDFEAIFDFLDLKNGFDNPDDMGFCGWCYSHDGQGCDTCAGEGFEYQVCTCKKLHRYGPSLILLDPRLHPALNFEALPERKRASLMLQFLRKVASNFHREDWEDWEKASQQAPLPGRRAGSSDIQQRQCTPEKMGMYYPLRPDLTMLDPKFCYGSNGFCSELKEYNLPFYNFIHHLLFAGWAENDTYGPPGSSPFRGRLLGDGKDYNAWNGGDNERFDDIFNCFMTLHKSDEEETVPVGSGYPRYTKSQVQYLPEAIRRCVANTVDHRAVRLLGKHIADSIDIYFLVRSTYGACKEELSEVKWMPCLGAGVEEFGPPADYRGYNPEHEHCNIDYTGLRW